jgi:acetyl-CoA acetyltransferase
MNVELKRGSAAIVGAAESELGLVAPHASPIDLAAQGVMRALDDAGLALSDVDAVYAATAQSRFSTLHLKEYLGLQTRWSDNTQIGGASFETHVAHAWAAIQLGLIEVAVIAYGSTQRSVSRKAASPREYNYWEAPYRPFMPSTAYALAAARHMHEYGTTREQLAEIAVAARQWALMNPLAWEREPLTVAEAMAARIVSWPLSVRDCCLVTDGGGALVMTSAARARTLKNEPVYPLAFGEALSHHSIAHMPELTRTAAAESGQRAYAMAGLRPSDIDVVELYDAFTITTLLFLEDLGFCPKGEGGRYVSGGTIAPGGTLPVNTNGGGLSYCHPGMYGLFILIEAVRQLRGQCGARQVAGAETALVHGNGGVLSSQVTLILGTGATL